jgi:hypothetical protein
MTNRQKWFILLGYIAAAVLGLVAIMGAVAWGLVAAMAAR